MVVTVVVIDRVVTKEIVMVDVYIWFTLPDAVLSWDAESVSDASVKNEGMKAIFCPGGLLPGDEVGCVGPRTIVFQLVASLCTLET